MSKRRNEQHVPEQTYHRISSGQAMLLVSNKPTKERHLCVERFAISLLPKCRNAETSNMFRSKPNYCISSGRNMLLVSNKPTKERHLCVERFAISLLPKCRNAETSNMFRSKPNYCISLRRNMLLVSLSPITYKGKTE